MNLSFSPQGWEDYAYWQATDAKMVRRINELLRDILRDPHRGVGKPEPLKHGFAGFWSRRIDQKHRLIYRVTADSILIAQARLHY